MNDEKEIGPMISDPPCPQNPSGPSPDDNGEHYYINSTSNTMFVFQFDSP